MNRRFARTAFKVKPATSDRKGWLLLVDMARTAAARASGTAVRYSGGPDTIAADLQHKLRDAKASDFPLQEASAVFLAESFLASLRAFALCATPERRTLCAPVLKATAGAIMDMLEDLRAEDARGWQARIPIGDR